MEKIKQQTAVVIPACAGITGERARHPVWMVVLASLWLTTFANAPLWREMLHIVSLSDVGLVLGFSLMVACAIAVLLSLLAWRFTLKPVITLFLFASAFGAYFMWTYHVVIDTTMIQNVLQTDVREVRDLLGYKMVLWVLLLAVLPSIWLWRVRLRTLGVPRYLLGNALVLIASLFILVGTGMLLFQSLGPLMRNHTQLRYLINPLNSFYALGNMLAKPYQLDQSKLLPLGLDAKLKPQSGKPPLILLVLGETARSTNFAINGYARPTTPELAKQNIATWRNAWSCGTSTAASVPCMFSNLGREHFDGRKANYENFLDVLQHAGLAVLWIDNQSGCKGVCARIPHVDTSELKNPKWCFSDGCFDEIMLENLSQRIAQLPAERRAKGVVVLMHAMGSHGPAYYKRSSKAFKKFLPECTVNALRGCKSQEIINAYDNSIVYTDHFLSEAINWLKSQGDKSDTAMIYISDHGASLGENNLYLHGMPYALAPDVQKHVPWITWLSPTFEKSSHITTECLKKRADAHVSHDYYFSSVLGLAGVQTSAYDRSMDAYADCAGR